MINKRIFSIFMIAFMLIMLVMPTTQVFANDDTEKANAIPTVKLTDGGIDISGGQFNADKDGGPWETLFEQYRTIIAGVSGIGALTMIILFVIQFMKLASSAGNPQARSQALTGVLWTGLAATGLGAVSLITGFFYNIL